MNDDDADNSHNVAIYGITGALGREIQVALEVEHEGIADLFAVAGVRSAGQVVRWRGASQAVRTTAEVTASDIDFAIFATPPEVVSREAARLLEAGARVVDVSGVLASPPLPKALRAPAPVVWPGVSSFAKTDLEAATALVLPAAAASTLAPLLDALTLPEAKLPRLEALSATLLMPASHAGREGIEALSRQTVGLLNHRAIIEPRPFPTVLAFNAVSPGPEAGVWLEAKATAELRQLVPALGAATIELTPIWIAAFSGIVASVHLRFAEPVPADVVRRLLAAHPDLDTGAGDAAPTADDGDDIVTALDVDAPADDDADGDDEVEAPVDPSVLSLRDALDSDKVRVGTPIFGGTSVRLVAMADPIHRTAEAVSMLLTRWIAVLA